MVGAGAFGRFCIEAYKRTSDITVALVVDPLVTHPVPGTRWERDLAAVLADSSIEAVHLATPPFLRGELAEPILDAGKSVFCEKPLALSLEEADGMLEAARDNGVALGIDYVMRHHRAFKLLDALASSSLFGRLRSFSLQNFAQTLPPNHWMWDRECSGGIFVEHGVHFFDAYGSFAGRAKRLWGCAPRRQAVDVMVLYGEDVAGRYYHEFGFPREVERTIGTLFFERGYVEIDGWIPTRLHGAVMASPQEVAGIGQLANQEMRVIVDEATHFDAPFEDRDTAYAASVVAGMRDLLARHRNRNHAMVVPAEQARESLALALAAEEVAQIGHFVEYSLLSPAPVE